MTLDVRIADDVRSSNLNVLCTNGMVIFRGRVGLSLPMAVPPSSVLLPGKPDIPETPGAIQSFRLLD